MLVSFGMTASIASTPTIFWSHQQGFDEFPRRSTARSPREVPFGATLGRSSRTESGSQSVFEKKVAAF
jgi:hypothetical protein